MNETIQFNETEIDILISALATYKREPYIYMNYKDTERINKLINKIQFNEDK